jgi:surface protein
MFSGCTNFNQELNEWSVSNVTDMRRMFAGCKNFNKPLNRWTVGNVTDMGRMFADCTKFNQPLNSWTVGNVTDMSGMFSGCTNFNQPLNSWTVGNVTDMNSMFARCTNFDQQLNSWTVRNFTDMTNMFFGCNISDGHKPIRPVAMERKHVVVDPTQVHKAAAKMSYSELNKTLKSKIGNSENNLNSESDYPEFIKTTIEKMIKDAFLIDATTSEEEQSKKKLLDGLERIMGQRLNRVEYKDKSPDVRDSIFYSLTYANMQSPKFKRMYVQSFIEDCVNAYENVSGNNMTCAAGALERIVFSLQSGCAASKNSDCEEIVSIIQSNPDELVLNHIRDWYMLHKNNGENKFTDITEDNKKESLKRYLKTNLPKGLPYNDDEWINSKLEGFGFEDDDFDYGGGRKTRRMRKMKKQRTRKKRSDMKKIKGNKTKRRFT